MRESKFEITKEHSSMVYGIAILLMLYHHMFCEKSRLNCEYISVLNMLDLGYDIELKVAWFCKLCVALYSFITGYGLCCSLKVINTESGLEKYLSISYKYVINHLLKFMKNYWLVFLIFIPIGYLLPWSRNHNINFIYLVTDFLGLTNKFNGEWWYVLEYGVILMCAPIVNYVVSKVKLKKRSVLLLAGVVVLLFLLALSSEYTMIYYIFTRIMKSRMIIYLLVFLVGFICAKWDLFNMLFDYEFIRNWKVLIAFGILFICVVVRVCVVKSPIDSFVDIFIVAPIVWSLCRIVDISCLKKIRRVLIHLGRYSVFMWLTHTFFCYYYFQEFITLTKISTLMYTQLLIVTYCIARILKCVEMKIIGKVNGKC